MVNYSSSNLAIATVGIVECWKYFLIEFLTAIHQHSVMISDILEPEHKLKGNMLSFSDKGQFKSWQLRYVLQDNL